MVNVEKKTFGLTGFQLKLIGTIAMVIDHIHQMFYMFGVPSWFNIIGRIAAPIFVFLVSEGFQYTRNRKNYLLRLLSGYWIMGVLNIIIQRTFTIDEPVLMNNIFGTLALSVVYMWLYDNIRKGIREKNYAVVVYSIIGMITPAVLSFALLQLAPVNLALFIVLSTALPTLFLVEGGFALVLLALLFYIFRKNRILQVVALAVMSLLSLISVGGIQWLMVLSALPIFFYNGKQGRKTGGFFYVFYPAHIYIFYLMSYYIQTNRK